VDAPVAGTLVSKSGAWGLTVVPAGDGIKVRAFVAIDGDGIHDILSDVVNTGTWHQAAAGFSDGKLTLSVDGKETSADVSGSIEIRAGPVAFGEDFAGDLDDVRLYDLTRPRLLAFEDGSFTTTTTIGPDGTATVKVKALGNLRTHSPNWHRDEIRHWIVDNVFPYIDFQQQWTLQMAMDFTDGFVTGEVDSPTHFVGDLISNILLYGDVRDGIIHGYKIGEGNGEFTDYFIVAISIIDLLLHITAVGELISGPIKTAFKAKWVKLAEMGDKAAVKLMGREALEALGEFLKANKTRLLNFVKWSEIILTVDIPALHTVSGGLFKNPQRVKDIIRLSVKVGDARIVRSLALIHDSVAGAEAVKAAHIGDLLDLLAHHVDEAAKAGLPEAAVLSEDALKGASRLIQETGDPAKSKDIVSSALLGQKNSGWHAGVAEEYFRYVQCVPGKTPGFSTFLSKVTGPLGLKGAYAVMRLYCEAPELAGKDIETIADAVLYQGKSKEGIDLITRIPSDVTGFSEAIPEFWEIKHVSTTDSAIKPGQVEKHLISKVADYYTSLRSRGLPPAQINQIMSRVRLRFDIIAEDGSAATRAKAYQDVLDLINLNQNFSSLMSSGFTFKIDDIFVRKASPLTIAIDKLPAAVH
jgi:hypothetical protein